MFTEIISSLNSAILAEIRKRVPENKVFFFRKTDDYGEETVFYDLAVGFPDEINYFPDVVQVWGGSGGSVFVTVRDAEGEDRDILINDVELSTGERASILDAIIAGEAIMG